MDYVTVWGETKYEEGLANQISQILSTTYPGLSWDVHIRDGVLSIRSMKISGNAGTRVHLRRFEGDAARLKREVILVAGELLEAAHLSRGAFQGENAKILEGIPTRQKAHLMPQPREYKPDGIIITDV